MTGFRSQTATGRTDGDPRVGPLARLRRWLPAATVAFVLVMGAVLRHDPSSSPAPSPSSFPAPGPALADAGPQDPPAAAAFTRPETGGGRPETGGALSEAGGTRPAAGGRGGEWTLQLGVYCDPGAIHELVEAAHPGAFLLEARHEGRDCRRLCWGRFPTAEAARRARPPAELAGAGSAFPQRLAEIGG